MTIRIKSDRVLEAAKKCPAAKEVLEILFPTVFESEAERASETIMRETSSTSVQGSSWTQPKFQLGDIVCYEGSHDWALLEDGLVGKVGKVVDCGYCSWGGFGVEFQDAIDRGHDCHGTGRKYHCEYIAEGSLTLLYRPPTGETK